MRGLWRKQEVFAVFALAFALDAARLAMAALLAATWARPLSHVAQLTAASDDTPLFAPGSEWFIRLISEHRHALVGHFNQRLLELLVAQVISVTVSSWVLTQIQRRKGSPGRLRLKETFTQLPAQLVFVAAFWGLVLLGAGTVKVAYPVIPALVYPLFGELGADVALACLSLLALAAVISARVWCEIARLSRFSATSTWAQTAVDAAFTLFGDWRFYLGISSAFLTIAVGLPGLACCTARALEHSNRWGWASAAACQVSLYLTCVAQILWWKLAAMRGVLQWGRTPAR